MQSRSWEQDGAKRSKVEVLANDVTFLDSRGGGDDGGAAGNGAGDNAGSANDDKPAQKKASKKKDDVVIEDIGDEPINLDDIPF